MAELGRLPETERIVLAGLDRSSVAIHAAAVLGVPPPPALVEELLRRGQGNPFYTEQLVVHTWPARRSHRCSPNCWRAISLP